MSNDSSEITVMSADDPNQRTVGFTMHERSGSTICKESAINVPLNNEDDLKEGDEILVPGLMGGYYRMTVKRDEYGVVYADGDRMMAPLEFAEDDRASWVAVALINKMGLSKLIISK